MTKTRYGHAPVGGGRGHQDRQERKDDDWQSRQGGRQSREPGRRGEPERERRRADERPESPPPTGTNTQGELAGIGEASDRIAQEVDRESNSEDGRSMRERDLAGAGTDQPPRMGGPLGPDPGHPHLPEGAQDGETRGTGAGGFDRGVDASRIGAVHQGVREEEPPA